MSSVPTTKTLIGYDIFRIFARSPREKNRSGLVRGGVHARVLLSCTLQREQIFGIALIRFHPISEQGNRAISSRQWRIEFTVAIRGHRARRAEF